MRQGDYKYVFSEQRKAGTMGVWAEPFTTLRLQKIFNLFQDPYERADITSNTYWDWQINHVGSAYGMMDEVFQFAATFEEFPPRSFPPSFNPTNVLEGKMRDDPGRKGAASGVPDAARAGSNRTTDRAARGPFALRPPSGRAPAARLPLPPLTCMHMPCAWIVHALCMRKNLASRGLRCHSVSSAQTRANSRIPLAPRVNRPVRAAMG